MNKKTINEQKVYSLEHIGNRKEKYAGEIYPQYFRQMQSVWMHADSQSTES